MKKALLLAITFSIVATTANMLAMRGFEGYEDPLVRPRALRRHPDAPATPRHFTLAPYRPYPYHAPAPARRRRGAMFMPRREQRRTLRGDIARAVERRPAPPPVPETVLQDIFEEQRRRAAAEAVPAPAVARPMPAPVMRRREAGLTAPVSVGPNMTRPAPTVRRRAGLAAPAPARPYMIRGAGRRLQ